MAIFLGFYAFFGISLAINTNLTEIFSKASLILFLILSRLTGEILGNFGQFLVIWHWRYVPSDKTIFCLFFFDIILMVFVNFFIKNIDPT